MGDVCKLHRFVGGGLAKEGGPTLPSLARLAWSWKPASVIEEMDRHTDTCTENLRSSGLCSLMEQCLLQEQFGNLKWLFYISEIQIEGAAALYTAEQEDRFRPSWAGGFRREAVSGCGHLGGGSCGC